MEITIDERIELITVVQTLCNYWENFQIKYCNGDPLSPNRYKENVQKYFGKYKEHNIIKLYNKLINDYEIWDITAFITLVLCYSNPPKLNVIADFENNWGKINGITMFPYKEFIDELKRFYTDTDFNIFFENNQNEYIKMLNSYGNKTELSIDTAFNYYDIKTDNYKIILSSLVLDGCGFGINIKTNKNEINNYSIISPYGYKDNKYLFGPISSQKSYLWHEIGHLIINDLTSNYINQFNIDIWQIPEIFLKNLINNKETIINEYIIRAITIRLFEINNENDHAKLLINKDIQKGFKDIIMVKEHIKNNFEDNQIFLKDDRFKELMEYVIKLIGDT